MLSYLRRKMALREVRSKDWDSRRRAIDKLAEMSAHPECFGALVQIARRAEDRGEQRHAIAKLGYVRAPAAVRELLSLLEAEPDFYGSYIFDDITSSLIRNIEALGDIEAEAVPRLVRLAERLARFAIKDPYTGMKKCADQGGRIVIRQIFKEMGTRAARSALLDMDRFERQRDLDNLPNLVRGVLEENHLGSAKAIVNRLAELGTPQARAALVEIAQKRKDDFIESGSTDYFYDYGSRDGDPLLKSETTYAMVPPRRLGDDLTGAMRELWDGSFHT